MKRIIEIEIGCCGDCPLNYREGADILEKQPKGNEWIPCSERLPEELTPVNITWTNHRPPDYYAHIKDVHFTDTGILYKGKWYWWSAYAKDALAECGNDEIDEMADEIEVLAWQPLPEPWKGEKENENRKMGV